MTSPLKAGKQHSHITGREIFKATLAGGKGLIVFGNSVEAQHTAAFFSFEVRRQHKQIHRRSHRRFILKSRTIPSSLAPNLVSMRLF